MLIVGRGVCQFITVGVDVGSMTVKAVLLNGDVKRSLIRPTGCSPRQAGADIFDELLKESGLAPGDVDYVVGTGYGRVSLGFLDKAVTEITCHAKGANYLVPGTDMVIDIGGQDSKVIMTDGNGNVRDFAMNDKCAAGTGRFLQVMATALSVDISELAQLTTDADPVEISNMCTVFAESEVVGLLAQGIDKERIIAGVHRSVARRVAAMAGRLGRGSLVVFTGGVALNDGVRRYLSHELGREVIVSPESQLAGALGAALVARERLVGR